MSYKVRRTPAPGTLPAIRADIPVDKEISNMTENERQIKLDEVRIKIADVIINLNLIEKEIKNAISYYVSSKKSFFMTEILLNNHIIGFANKVKVLQFIIRDEKIEVSKDFYKALTLIMSKRNVLAHSDTVLEDYTVDDVEVEWEPDGVISRFSFFHLANIVH